MTEQSSPSSIGVVWLDARRALILASPGAAADLVRIERGADPEVLYLLRVARVAAACDRLIVLGSDWARLAFEREFVALYRQPERVVDVTDSLMPDAYELVRRFNLLDAPAA